MKVKVIVVLIISLIVFSFVSCIKTLSEDKLELQQHFDKFTKEGIGTKDIKIIERFRIEEISKDNKTTRDNYENIYYLNASDNFYYVSEEDKDHNSVATILDEVDSKLLQYDFTSDGYHSQILSDSLSRDEFLSNVNLPEIIIPFGGDLSGAITDVDVARIYSDWSGIDKHEEEFFFTYLGLPSYDKAANEGNIVYEYEKFKTNEYVFRAYSEYITEDESTVEFNYVLLLYLMDAHNYYGLMNFWRYTLASSQTDIDMVWEPDTNFGFKVEAQTKGYAKVKLVPGDYEITYSSFAFSHLIIKLLDDDGEELEAGNAYHISETGYYFIEVSNQEDSKAVATLSIRRK
ncbi:MAG: hypothetical protein JXL85_02095 [Bacilli bacterium]|nr:hypothetical protein [Bacilli bacterium]